LIGGENIPSTPSKINTRAAAELYKALNEFGAQSHTNLLTRSSSITGKANYVISADFESHPTNANCAKVV
jgi:hypothetical protein